MTKCQPSDRLAWALALLYGLDRLLKLLAVRSFFRRQPPPAPEVWPSDTLICPITRSPKALQPALRTRTRLDYPGPQRCLFICDEADAAAQALCRELIAAHPAWSATLLIVKPDHGAVASKVTKMRAA